MPRQRQRAEHKVTVHIAGRNVSGYLRLRGGTYHADIHLPDGFRLRWSTHETQIDPATKRLSNYMGEAAFKEDVKRRIVKGPRSPIDRAQHAATFRDAANYYCEIYLKNKNAARKTFYAARKMSDDFAAFCEINRIKRASDIDRKIIDSYTADLFKRGLEAKTVQNYLTMNRAVLNAAHEAELIPLPNVRKWRMPKLAENTVEPLKMGDVKKMLDIIREHAPVYYNLILWLTLTGCRPSDAVDLRFGQVDMNSRIVQRTQIKTRRIGTYEISKQAAALIAEEKLRRRAGKDDHVFADDAGIPFTTHRLYHQFTRTLVAHGMPDVNPYQLRHTFAFVMANEVACPLPVLQRMMGHSNIQTTMRYVIPSDGRDFTESYSGRVLKGKHAER